MSEKPNNPTKNIPERSSASRRYAVLAAGLLTTFFIVMILALKHPSDYKVIPSCPFHTGTGILCPGCGSMRATHFLLIGNLTASLRHNPLVILFLPLIFFLILRWFCEVFFQKSIPFPWQNTVYWSVAVIFILFFVIRNLPFEFLELLRPPERSEDEFFTFLPKLLGFLRG